MGRQVTPLLGQYVRNFVFLAALALIAACSSPQESRAAPYAAFVMDARTGETLYSENANTRLHPASLTKMMTLYIAFEEIERGTLSLDTMITVTKNAAAQPPSRLGLKAGQKIQLRYLIRAAAVKSANDAAQAIGDHIGGNQEKFATRMTRTAKAIGMKNTTFKNANGLTAKGHLSTAQDMSVLGRHLFYDFPQYYNIFSRRTTDAGMAEVANTNRRFLDAYKGADGIKTGYTEPAGFNLTASAERGNVRIIATVFGGKSTADRNAKVSDLLDLGFKKAPRNANEAPPATPQYQNADEEMIASANEVDALPEVEGGSAKTLRVVMSMKTSPRPMLRPSDTDMLQTADATEADATENAVAAMADGIAGALAEATGAEPAPGSLDAQAVALADGTVAASGIETLSAPQADLLVALAPAAPALSITAAPANAQAVKLISTPRPQKRKAPIYDEVLVAEADQASDVVEVVTRVSTSGGKHWGINVGRFNSHGEAERVLLKTQLVESATLASSLRKIVQKSGGYDANFLGLGQEEADLACRRLQARGVQCFTMGP